MADLNSQSHHSFLWGSNKIKPLYPGKWDILAFIIPASTLFEIDAIGRLFGPDIICLTIFPILLYKRSRILHNSFARLFICLGILYLLGQFVADIVHQSDFHDYSRGWAKILVTIISFCTIIMVIDRRRSAILAFSWGIVAGLSLQFFFKPGDYAEFEPWKFGIGVPITWLIILISSLFRNTSIVKLNIRFFLVFSAGVLNLYFGFRSLGGICFLTLAFLMLQRFLKSSPDILVNNTKKRILILSIGMITAAFLVIQIYGLSARNGWLGEVQAEKFEAQAHGNFGLILGGRSEILVSSKAIMESPILGHGSWVKNWVYAEMLVDLKRQFGYISGPVNDLGLIPTHSHFFGAWVEAGLLGAIFWGWVLSLPIRASTRLVQADDPHTPILSFILFFLVWDILFSPFGATRRFLIPFYTIVMIDILMRYPGRLRKLRYARLYCHNLV